MPRVRVPCAGSSNDYEKNGPKLIGFEVIGTLAEMASAELKRLRQQAGQLEDALVQVEQTIQDAETYYLETQADHNVVHGYE